MEIPIDRDHLEELRKIARPLASSIHGDGTQEYNFHEAWELQERGEIELPSLVDLVVARMNHYESLGKDTIQDFQDYKGKKSELISQQMDFLFAGDGDGAAKVSAEQTQLDNSFAEIHEQIRSFYGIFLPCWTKDGYGLVKNDQGAETEQFGSVDLVEGRTVPRDSFDLDIEVGGAFRHLTGIRKQGSLYIPVFSADKTNDFNLTGFFDDDRQTREDIESGSYILPEALSVGDKIGFRPIILGDRGEYKDNSVTPISSVYRAKIWSLER